MVARKITSMDDSFATYFTGWSYVAAAAMLWLGWMALPAKLGDYFEPEDFGRVHSNLQLWIWCFRVHLFGHVVSTVALVALASQLLNSPSRVLILPGVTVATAGIFVTALAAAFYYHFGAWGALDMHGKSAGELQAFIDSLRIPTEYVTCLVRFGRVFPGLGLVLLGAGFIKYGIFPTWISIPAIIIGVAAMGLTMGLPDDLSLYMPVFHAWSIWLVLVGVEIIRRGLPADR